LSNFVALRQVIQVAFCCYFILISNKLNCSQTLLKHCNMNRKANLPAKRRKSATLIDFKSNFSTSQPARNVSEDQLLEGELLSRSLRAANQKPNQSMRQDGLATEWSMMHRKPATNRRNSPNTRFMSPVKTPVSQPQTDFNAQKNQPKYLFQGYI
jgi:hypothetical protein